MFFSFGNNAKTFSYFFVLKFLNTHHLAKVSLSCVS